MKKNFFSYEEAQIHAQSLSIKSQSEWWKYVNSDARCTRAPIHPERVYKNKGWTSWGEFLGTGKIAHRYKTYVSFEEAKTYVHTLKLKNQEEWQKYCPLCKLPDNIPRHPCKIYKDKGWISWGDFLGTGTISTKYRKFVPYEEAKAYTQKLELKSKLQWEKYCKSGKRPENIPTNPSKIYKDKGWISFGDFLGKKETKIKVSGK